MRAPRDKPHVEAGVRYARERWWKGGHFRDLADAREQAERWCRDVAGLRVHGTSRRLPRVVFEDEERQHLRPYDGTPYDVPAWREVTVHPDDHVGLQYALYSAPSTACPPGTKLDARCDYTLVKLYRRGELVKVHARQPKGGRSTVPDDYPPEFFDPPCTAAPFSRQYRNPIAVAQEWQRLLSTGVCVSRADLARQLGVTRARVTQVLSLLALTPEVIDGLTTLGDPLPGPTVSEHRLRALLKRPATEQKLEVRMLVGQPGTV